VIMGMGMRCVSPHWYFRGIRLNYGPRTVTAADASAHGATVAIAGTAHIVARVTDTIVATIALSERRYSTFSVLVDIAATIQVAPRAGVGLAVATERDMSMPGRAWRLIEMGDLYIGFEGEIIGAPELPTPIFFSLSPTPNSQAG
jgi:hypothetical protein